jgi:hypothetical protein
LSFWPHGKKQWQKQRPGQQKKQIPTDDSQNSNGESNGRSNTNSKNNGSSGGWGGDEKMG